MGPTQTARVLRVVDGDTVHVLIDGSEYTLRYIGIDSPEDVKPNTPVEPWSLEAAEANERLVDGREVVLERDVSNSDRYGRLLRYVWLPVDDGWLFVNEELVRMGLAESKAYPPDTMWQARLDDAEDAARAAGRGIWSSTSQRPGFVSCDPSYPDVCIPPPPPDLDCADITFRRFKVKPPDPHNFDGDHNGVGCEGS